MHILCNLLKKEGFNSIMDWIKTDLSDVAKHNRINRLMGRYPNEPFLTKFTHENDLKVLQYAEKLEALLMGKNDYM